MYICVSGEIARFPPFSVLLRGTLCPFSQLFPKKFWWFHKLFLSLQPCRIVGNAEERPMNVTHRQRHEVERNPNGLLHLFFVYMFSHNSHSNLECGHIDKKDRFADLGKSAHDERFVLFWDNSPPFARNPHTLNLCLTTKCIKNESTSTKSYLNISRMLSKCSQPCRSDKRKKT